MSRLPTQLADLAVGKDMAVLFWGHGPIMLADLAVGNLASLHAFLSGEQTHGTSLAAQLDARLDTERQDTLLTWAARHGQAGAVRLLLEAGASVGAADGDAASALVLACWQGCLECARLLLEARAAVNQAAAGGSTPLLVACEEGHVECARQLLEASAAVNQADDGGFTPLYVACELGHLECVRLLLEASAAVNQATTRGSTPLLIACQNGHVECAPLLLEADAAVGQANQEGVTPLLIACEKGHVEIVRLLLKAGAAVDQADDEGATPLFIACLEGQLEIVRLLLEAGAAIDQADEQGATPLFIACHHGHLEVVKLLSSYGASRAATPPYGTPEVLANRRGHADLAAWLVASRGWTPLQHLEALTVDRARALLRGGADSSAGEPSALERARVLCSWGESDPTAAAVGSTVTIHSLVSRPSMNGKVGVVVSAHPRGLRRWPPQRPPARSAPSFKLSVAGEASGLLLEPANLQPAAEAVEVGRLILKAAEWSPQSHALFPTAARKWAVEVMRLGYLIAWDEERFDGREGAAPELADIWRSFVLPRVVVR